MEVSHDVPPPRVKHAIFGLLAVATTANMIGIAFSPYLLVQHPLILVGLAPVGRHVALAAPAVSLVPMLVVCTLRRVIGLTASYGIGYLYGDSAVAWAEKRYPRFGAMIRFVERLFVRWGMILVLIAPSHTLALLAGAGRARYLAFAAIAGLGELIWIWLTYYFGEAVSDWTEPVIRFVRENLLVVSLVVLGLVVLQQILSRRRTPRDQA